MDILFGDVKKKCEEADFCIVGIGELVSYDWSRIEKDDRYIELISEIENESELEWVIPFLQKIVMDKYPDENLIKTYQELAKLSELVDTYYITTTIDDYIYASGLDKNRIVTPCGGFRRLQCEKICSDDMINLPFALLQYVQKLYNKMISLDEIRDKYPECPNCGANLVFNQVGAEHYNEHGYLDAWKEYQDWMQKTMNKKVVMLELGAGLGFMSVFRSPFERIATYNLKSELIRVHPTLYMSTPEIKERCISVGRNPMEWILTDR